MFTRLRVKRLIAQLRDHDHPNWANAMRELATLPKVDGAVDALVGQLDGSGGLHENLVVETLGGVADERASMALARRLSHPAGGHGQWRMAKALAHPRHAPAVAEIMAAARREYSRTDACNWAEETLRRIGTAEALSGIESLRGECVPYLLRAARKSLGLGFIPTQETEALKGLGSAAANDALRQIEREMVKPLLHMALTHENFGAVRDALAQLSEIATPEAHAALEHWHAQPARVLTRVDYHEEQDDSGALRHWESATQVLSSCFGQAPEPAPPPPEAMPDHRILCERLVEALRQQGMVPAGNPTLGEIARHADAALGRTDVSRFVFEFYYPLQYGEHVSAEASHLAQDVVRQIERS